MSFLLDSKLSKEQLEECKKWDEKDSHHLEENILKMSTQQLTRIMDAIEVEIINRLAAEHGQGDPDEHDPG